MANPNYPRKRVTGNYTIRKKCSDPDCEFQAVRAGKCKRHSPGSKQSFHALPRGECLRWLKRHVSIEQSACLIWPFGRISTGYGLATYRGQQSPASRIMCILRHGDPPFPDAQAAHSCGNGSGGCVNPGHLRWATPAQNAGDKLDHGTLLRGEQISQSKLTRDQARRIFVDVRPLRTIAADYQITKSSVSDIIDRKHWAWATADLEQPPRRRRKA